MKPDGPGTRMRCLALDCESRGRIWMGSLRPRDRIHRKKIEFAAPRIRSLKVQVIVTDVSTPQRKVPSLMNTLAQSVEVVADPWKQSTYYDDAERWTFIFWSEDHPFYPLFKLLDSTAVLELACGHGRHSEIVAERSSQLTVMDVHEQNIEYCRHVWLGSGTFCSLRIAATTFDLSEMTRLRRSFAMMRWCISALTLSKPICAIRHGS